MNWNALKHSICPKCGSVLVDKAVLVVCSKCDFKISTKRLIEIIKSKPKYHTPSEEENLEALNNLKQTTIVEEIIDSPFL